jgi:hypothetical protein
MPTIFSSPFLTETHKQPEKTEYAISYHLEKAIPRGSVIYALFPKKILGKLLPPIAKAKNCTIITHLTGKAGKIERPDIILTEPDGFSAGGALFTPEETKIVSGLPIVCVGSTKQWTHILPATHDLVPVYRIISERGIHTSEQMEEIISFSLKP